MKKTNRAFMKQNHKAALLLFTIALFLALTSCANSMEEPHGSESLSSPMDSMENSEPANDTIAGETGAGPSETDSEGIRKDESILADLNNDGIDDKIFVTYDDEQNSSATIKVINGKDDSELMSDTLKLDADKTGAYYLQKGKGNELDRLVFWNYVLLDNGTLTFTYSVFSYDPDGTITYGDRGGQNFDVSNDSSIARGHQKFLLLREDVNENIQASRSIYNCYLLLDNQGDTLIISTAENLQAPTDLLFELEDFAVDTNTD